MSLKESTDEDLLLRYAGGEAAAFDLLYKRYNGLLFRFVLRHCSDSSVVEELYQDIWVKLINSKDRYEVKAKFSTYLFHIARNRITDHFRQQGHRKILTSLDFDSENIPAKARTLPAAQPDGQAIVKSEIKQLVSLVEQLPEVQREAFLLREEAGMSVEEIAEVTGVARETAKSRLRYAVQSLRSQLQ
ncbi:MAG: RNA polymerase sigma-70 factor (ECF subfamily) [Parasphingorhabdus sp.]|jgi:RNA polymerase sigma-70 factor (ECF subfamily)